jgi:hypothetical protein
VELPGIFGVFYYRSANPRTLAALKGFIPVPAEGLAREFAAGATAEEICARTIRALLDAGGETFLHQQPADRPRAAGARERVREGGAGGIGRRADGRMGGMGRVDR